MQDPILILGASGTIGGAIATRLVGDGHAVLLHGRTDSDRLRELGETLDAPTITTDISETRSLDAFAADLHERTKALAGLVFAVARPLPHRLAHRTDWSVFQEQFDTQLKFLHETIRATKPLMETAESGARVIVLSTEFVLGAPPQKIAPYVAAKAALTTYARVAAQELIKQGIRVHILAPGMVESALTADMPAEYLAEVAAAMPEKRLTSAMDVADVAQFLFTPAADSMYGTVIPVSRADRR